MNNDDQILNQKREELIKLLNIEKLSKEKQNKVLNTLGEIAVKKATRQILKMISNKKRAILISALDSKDSAKISSFFHGNVPNFNEIFQNASRVAIKEYQEKLSKSKNN